MPATATGTGTEKFTSFDERRYTLRVVECKATTSPPPDNREQYEWRFALEGSADPETGGEVVRRAWTSTIWNETAGKESHLVLVARALCGLSVTREEFEALDFRDLEGLRGSAMVTLNSQGYPTIDKTTFRPIGTNAAPKGQATLPAAAPAAPKRPAPPARPANLRTDAQRDDLLAAGLANDPPMSADDLNTWIGTEYPGKTLDSITQDEATALIAAFGVPF